MPKTEDLLLRLGNIQLLTFWEGTGMHRRPKARVTKLVSEEALEQNPDAAREFSMEELAALEVLCKEATTQALNKQSIDIGNLRRSESPPADPPPKATKRKRSAKKTAKKKTSRRAR